MIFNHTTPCQICGERTATIFITLMDGPQPVNQSMCEVCALEQTQGEEWLKAMAKKFGLPEEATLEDVMVRIAEQMPEFDLAQLGPSELSLTESTSGGNDDVPAIILEANLQFSSEFPENEFPADEDAADDLDEAWEETESPSGEDHDDLLQSLKDAVKMDLPSPQNILEAAQKPGKEAAREIVAERCPKCGTTWDRLREDGRAGCAQCYVAFHDRLIEVMNRMQREPQHVGKTPRAALKRRRRLEHLRARRDHQLAMLTRRLQEAVAAENYEDAAKLRDKIKMVSSTIVSDQT